MKDENQIYMITIMATIVGILLMVLGLVAPIYVFLMTGNWLALLSYLLLIPLSVIMVIALVGLWESYLVIKKEEGR